VGGNERGLEGPHNCLCLGRAYLYGDVSVIAHKTLLPFSWQAHVHLYVRQLYRDSNKKYPQMWGSRISQQIVLVKIDLTYFTHLDSSVVKIANKGLRVKWWKTKARFIESTRIVVLSTSLCDHKARLTRKLKNKTDAKYWTASFKQLVMTQQT